MDAYQALGTWVNSSFGVPQVLTRLDNQVLSGGPAHQYADLPLPQLVGTYKAHLVRYITIMEDQTDGQRIWGWEVLGRQSVAADWLRLFSGQSIGHKRILDCGPDGTHCGGPGGVATIRFNVTLTATSQAPALHSLVAYAEASPVVDFPLTYV